MTRSYLPEALDRTLSETHFDALGKKYEGKVRDNYSTPDGRRIIVVTDRISAFDRVLGTIPLKGQVLNRLAGFWFEKTKDLVPNHMRSLPDPQAIECIECAPVQVEFVVRAYATGNTSTSLWTHYEKGSRLFCGHVLPEGLKKHQKLPEAIVTPATKAAIGAHDISGSREEMIASGNVTPEIFDRAAAMAMTLFSAGARFAESRGLILVDTKYEFGITKAGQLLVIDEIHTPDSSRYWLAESYESRVAEGLDPASFDKDVVRRALLNSGYRGDGPAPELSRALRLEAAEAYITAFERITGETFIPNLDEPVSRLQKNLHLA